ncbi:hypothetical protein [Pseudomonas syringae]|uniref:hypothetical protein n=1 Tax=Pseudomonas syringae TaxID=317 RepID=UPI001EF9F1A4|nr:hypothetical protein [Pseudomonas syringae]
MRLVSYCRITGNQFSYARRDGRTDTDDLTRMHLVMLTNLGFELLGEALECHSRKAWHVRHPDFIELRWQLRMHLKRYLGARLVRDGFASSSIRDEHFADDLGL